ncbi:MAG TPA: gliding motility-associated C-terminal domain-containing protein, partial [Bacteroidia bacterium]|nr:gliding motility-associated C-terminal domain-containing protein [Bacteroidia bacterium]
ITLTGSTTICQGTSTTITASGGGTYSWNTGVTTAAVNVSPASTTTYSVQVTKTGCVKDSTFTINVNPKPALTVTPPSPGICSGGSVGLTASNASTYAWSPSSGLNTTTGASVTASPASTSTYTVIGTSALGCKDTSSVTVTVGASLTASITGKDTVCAGNSTTLTAAGGSSYKWSNGSTSAAINVTPASTATYSVLVSSGTCKDSSTVTVKVNPSFVAGISGVTSICNGNSTTLTATGGGTYAWSTGVTTASINVSPASTSTYSVQVDKGGCIKDSTVSVTVNNPPAVTITKGSTICAGKSVILTATGGGTYAWSNGATTSVINVSPASTITYSVTVSNGCPKDTSTVITVSPSPIVTISGSNSICAGSNTTLTASGGGTYAWNTGVTTAVINVTPASTTTYSVQVSNGTCNTDTTITVTVNAKPIPSVSAMRTICDGTTTLLSAGGGSTYAWSPVAGLNCTSCPTVAASPNTTTNYTVVIANGGCAATDSVKVIVNPMPVGTANGSTTIIAGQNTPITILPVAAGETYSWSPSASLSCTNCANPTASPIVTTTYYVIITDSGGCTKMDSVVIIVDKNCGAVFVPEAFSPNGDGQNDVLYVRGDCIKTMDFVVFDRWGNKVFESMDVSNGWDGKYNGQPMNAGTYVYYLHALNIYNADFTQKGNITLVR